MQGWEGQGEQPPWASSSPAASTASHDLGRLMGRGSPHPVFLLTGQGYTTGGPTPSPWPPSQHCTALPLTRGEVVGVCVF